MKKKLVFTGFILLILAGLPFVVSYIIEKRKMAEVNEICSAIQGKDTRKEVERAIQGVFPYAKAREEYPERQRPIIDSYVDITTPLFKKIRIGSYWFAYEYLESVQITTDNNEKIDFVHISFERRFWNLPFIGSHFREIGASGPKNCKAYITNY